MAKATSWATVITPTPLFTRFQSVSHIAYTVTQRDTDTHTHTTTLPSPRERAVRARLSSALTSHHYSLSRFLTVSHREPAAGTSRRGDKYWITWKPFTLLSRVTRWHAHTHIHGHTWASVVYVSHTASHTWNLTETCWGCPVTTCQWSVCVCVESSSYLLPRDFPSSSCGLKNHFPILTNPLSIKHLQQSREEEREAERGGEKESHSLPSYYVQEDDRLNKHLNNTSNTFPYKTLLWGSERFWFNSMIFDAVASGVV